MPLGMIVLFIMAGEVALKYTLYLNPDAREWQRDTGILFHVFPEAFDGPQRDTASS